MSDSTFNWDRIEGKSRLPNSKRQTTSAGGTPIAPPGSIKSEPKEWKEGLNRRGVPQAPGHQIAAKSFNKSKI